MKRKIVLDTNFLLVPYQFRLDVFAEIEKILEGPYSLIVPTGVVHELEKLSSGKGKEGAAARFGLKLIRMKEYESVKSSGIVDNWILDYAKKEGAVVATNDRKLRERLKKQRVKVISLLSRSKVGVV